MLAISDPGSLVTDTTAEANVAGQRRYAWAISRSTFYL